MGAIVYMLRCSDGSFYIGSTRTLLDDRVARHNAGSYGGYTAVRLNRPGFAGGSNS